MLAVAIFILWLNSNSVGMLFHQNIEWFMGKLTSGRLWTNLRLWAQIFSPTDEVSPCGKYKPSDNRLPICWLLTLYLQGYTGCRLKAADLNINQLNSAEGFLCVCHAARKSSATPGCGEAGGGGLTWVVMGWLWKAPFQDFLLQGFSAMQD